MPPRARSRTSPADRRRHPARGSGGATQAAAHCDTDMRLAGRRARHARRVVSTGRGRTGSRLLTARLQDAHQKGGVQGHIDCCAAAISSPFRRSTRSSGSMPSLTPGTRLTTTGSTATQPWRPARLHRAQAGKRHARGRSSRTPFPCDLAKRGEGLPAARQAAANSAHSCARDITGGPGGLIDMLVLARRRLHGGAEAQAD
jgi:hypothetical protein